MNPPRVEMEKFLDQLPEARHEDARKFVRRFAGESERATVAEILRDAEQAGKYEDAKVLLTPHIHSGFGGQDYFTIHRSLGLKSTDIHRS